MIRYILTIYTSRFDINGNRETFATVTSAATGKSLAFRAHSAGNAYAAVANRPNRQYLTYPALFRTEQDEIPIRQWARMAKCHDLLDERAITPELLSTLDTGEY